MTDPTLEEMVALIGDSDDAIIAIYWFASDWHGGQWSNLYSVLSTSQYEPGPLASGPKSEGFDVEILYNQLESEFCND